MSWLMNMRNMQDFVGMVHIPYFVFFVRRLATKRTMRCQLQMGLPWKSGTVAPGESPRALRSAANASSCSGRVRRCRRITTLGAAWAAVGGTATVPTGFGVQISGASQTDNERYARSYEAFLAERVALRETVHPQSSLPPGGSVF